MRYQILLKQKVIKEIEKIPENDKKRIDLTLIELSLNPFIGKKLEGEYKNAYSLRVWPYRIIYEIYKSQLIIDVIKIGHRQGIYK